MLRAVLVIAAGFTALFAGLIVTGRAQPGIASELNELLRDGCRAPCMLGIHPGQSDSGEAQAQLAEHAWVAVDSLHRSRSSIAWRWSGRQPGFIDPEQPGLVMLSPENDQVQLVTIATRLRAGDLHLALGRPPIFTVGMSGIQSEDTRLFISEFYVRQALFSDSESACPLYYPTHLLTTVTRLTVFDEQPAAADWLMSPLVNRRSASKRDYRRVCDL